MKHENLNNWISLVANIGVLVGIIFVSIELSQANRIGTNSAESDLSDKLSDLSDMRITNSDLFVKLQNNDELSPKENIETAGVSVKYVAFWASVESTFRNGLIEDYVYDIYVSGIRSTYSAYPGLRPFFASTRDAANYRKGTSGTIDVQLEELEKYGF